MGCSHSSPQVFVFPSIVCSKGQEFDFVAGKGPDEGDQNNKSLEIFLRRNSNRDKFRSFVKNSWSPLFIPDGHVGNDIAQAKITAINCFDFWVDVIDFVSIPQSKFQCMRAHFLFEKYLMHGASQLVSLGENVTDECSRHFSRGKLSISPAVFSAAACEALEFMEIEIFPFYQKENGIFDCSSANRRNCSKQKLEGQKLGGSPKLEATDMIEHGSSGSYDSVGTKDSDDDYVDALQVDSSSLYRKNSSLAREAIDRYDEEPNSLVLTLDKVLNDIKMCQSFMSFLEGAYKRSSVNTLLAFNDIRDLRSILSPLFSNGAVEDRDIRECPILCYINVFYDRYMSFGAHLKAKAFFSTSAKSDLLCKCVLTRDMETYSEAVESVEKALFKYLESNYLFDFLHSDIYAEASKVYPSEAELMVVANRLKQEKDPGLVDTAVPVSDTIVENKAYVSVILPPLSLPGSTAAIVRLPEHRLPEQKFGVLPPLTRPAVHNRATGTTLLNTVVEQKQHGTTDTDSTTDEVGEMMAPNTASEATGPLVDRHFVLRNLFLLPSTFARQFFKEICQFMDTNNGGGCRVVTILQVRSIFSKFLSRNGQSQVEIPQPLRHTLLAQLMDCSYTIFDDICEWYVKGCRHTLERRLTEGLELLPSFGGTDGAVTETESSTVSSKSMSRLHFGGRRRSSLVRFRDNVKLISLNVGTSTHDSVLSFNELLNHSQGCSLFKLFLEEIEGDSRWGITHSFMVAFMCEMEFFRQIQSPTVRQIQSRVLFCKYVHASCPFPLPLSYETREKLLVAFNRSKYDDPASSSIFNRAIEEVFQYLEVSLYPRFVDSTHYLKAKRMFAEEALKPSSRARRSSISTSSSAANASRDFRGLKNILQYQGSTTYFKLFCNRTFCSESLYFWLDVEHYQNLPGSDYMSRAAWKIFRKYIDDSAKLQINISSNQRRYINAEIKHPHRFLFKKVQDEIFALMTHDTMPKFLLSNEFTMMVKYMEN